MTDPAFSEVFNDMATERDIQARSDARFHDRCRTLEEVITVLNETANAYLTMPMGEPQSVGHRLNRHTRGDAFLDAAHKVRVLLNQTIERHNKAKPAYSPPFTTDVP